MGKKNNPEYAAKARAIRHYLGMKQSEMASHLGISTNTLCNYERGNTAIKLAIWEKLQHMAPELFPPSRQT